MADITQAPPGWLDKTLEDGVNGFYDHLGVYPKYIDIVVPDTLRFKYRRGYPLYAPSGGVCSRIYVNAHERSSDNKKIVLTSSPYLIYMARFDSGYMILTTVKKHFMWKITSFSYGDIHFVSGGLPGLGKRN